MIAVSTNNEAIHTAIDNELRPARIFQSFITELLKNDFTNQDRWRQIRDLIFNGNLDSFLLEHAAKHNKYFASMPIKHSEILRQIDLEKEYENYHEMKLTFEAIEALPIKQRMKINSYYINANNQIALNDNYLTNLKTEHTTYLNEKQYQIYSKAKEVLKGAQELQKESGVNIFRSGFVINTQYGNLLTSDININYIKSLQ